MTKSNELSKIQQIIISAQLGGICSFEAAQQIFDLFAVTFSLPSQDDNQKCSEISKRSKVDRSF